MLNFVFQQSVHEAGHALAAILFEIPFGELRIVYDPMVDLAWDLESVVPELSESQLRRLQESFAAGAAAEQLVFHHYWVWGVEQDSKLHRKCGGVDFDQDILQVLGNRDFRSERVRRVAELAEYHYRHDRTFSTSRDEILATLKPEGIDVRW